MGHDFLPVETSDPCVNRNESTHESGMQPRSNAFKPLILQNAIALIPKSVYNGWAFMSFQTLASSERRQRWLI
jgi:hypothetical protein